MRIVWGDFRYHTTALEIPNQNKGTGFVSAHDGLNFAKDGSLSRNQGGKGAITAASRCC